MKNCKKKTNNPRCVSKHKNCQTYPPKEKAIKLNEQFLIKFPRTSTSCIKFISQIRWIKEGKKNCHTINLVRNKKLAPTPLPTEGHSHSLAL